MLHALRPHPDFPCTAVQGIYAQLERRARGLMFDFVIRGDIDELLIPALATPRSVDELWRHTCCEAFLAAEHADSYFEFNFSPSTEWAVYRFDAYRAGGKAIDKLAPAIEVHQRDDELQIIASVRLSDSELDAQPLSIALTAMIEERIGRKSYWALEHAPGKPDFHRRETFIIDFPAS